MAQEGKGRIMVARVVARLGHGGFAGIMTRSIETMKPIIRGYCRLHGVAYAKGRRKGAGIFGPSSAVPPISGINIH